MKCIISELNFNWKPLEFRGKKRNDSKVDILRNYVRTLLSLNEHLCNRYDWCICLILHVRVGKFVAAMVSRFNIICVSRGKLKELVSVLKLSL